ncbi:type II toxin-antitoxin system VapC family toxin [Caminibacter pacificus]|uniref:Nucleic acid-binding protein n=1 Tax=Caminibacter pacificus TaxID=1424653 RepID=A0AAJ4UX72_9BACT|nr:PIN domain-containing protein [Caminibacter pacificus]NPA88327.1 PIN domain-containing protein [Campylobacterota bacterium]QCI29165.1 PIN domain-containing protein [Caminibacter pacificus]ROR38808.1 putative nucleic acid-binding protein [Caminibacter pacificus]
MKVLLDINIVLDFFMEREPYFKEIKKIFNAVEKRKIDGFLCASSMDTIHYLVQKAYNKKTADDVVYKLLKLFDVTPVTKEVLLEALNSGFNDFEDSIIYSSAYLQGIDFIITRDKKGFKTSKVKVLTPVEFLSKIVD